MIEVGEYIRTKKGYIIKITECLGKDVGYKNMEHYEVDYYIPYRGYTIYKEDIKAHSKNIIDLIEVGDIVNGCEVMNIHKPMDIWEPIEVEINSKCTRCFLEVEIKTILTHEQYEQNCYKVVE